MRRQGLTTPGTRSAGLRLAIAGFALSLVGWGCTDRSRAVNADLRDRIHQLQQDNADLTAQVSELERHLEDLAEPDDQLQEAGHPAIPLVTSIAVSGVSGRRLEPDEDGNRPLDVHVVARDGRNRPIQLAGTMRVKLTVVPEDESARELAVVDLSPEELREAWRGGPLGGPSWLVRIPVNDLDFPAETTSLGVDVFYEDLRTGVQLQCGDKVDIR